MNKGTTLKIYRRGHSKCAFRIIAEALQEEYNVWEDER